MSENNTKQNPFDVDFSDLEGLMKGAILLLAAVTHLPLYGNFKRLRDRITFTERFAWLKTPLMSSMAVTSYALLLATCLFIGGVISALFFLPVLTAAILINLVMTVALGGLDGSIREDISAAATLVQQIPQQARAQIELHMPRAMTYLNISGTNNARLVDLTNEGSNVGLVQRSGTRSEDPGIRRPTHDA